MVFPIDQNGFNKTNSTLFTNIMLYYDDDKMNNNNNNDKIVGISSPTSSSTSSSRSSSSVTTIENEIRTLSDGCEKYETKTQDHININNIIIMGRPSENDTTASEKTKNFSNKNDQNIANNIESCASEPLTKNIIILKNKLNDYFIDDQQHQNQKLINSKLNNKRNNNDIHNNEHNVDNNNESLHILYEYEPKHQPNQCETIILNNMDKTIITTTTPLSSTSSSSSSSSSASDFTTEIENKKVEPLKINLNRDHLKTIIKKQPQIEHHAPKITIKPIRPPQSQLESLLLMDPVCTSNSDTGGGGAIPERNSLMTNSTMTPQIIPKIHIRNISDNSSSSSSNIEPHIVPKLTIRSVAPQPVAASASCSSSSSSCSSSSSSTSSIVSNSDGEVSHSVVPKLTIRMDNHSSGSYCSSFNNQDKDCTNFSTTVNDVVPKLHIKPIVNDEQNMLTNEGIRLTIKPIPVPPLPKLTIKTSPMKLNSSDLSSSTSTTTSIVCNNYSPKLYDSLVGQTSPIPKITIKSISKGDSSIKSNRTVNDIPVIPKLTIKPIIYNEENEILSQHHSHQQQNPSIPILKLKIPKEHNEFESPYSPNKLSSSKETSSNVSTASSVSPNEFPTSTTAVNALEDQDNLILTNPINEPLEILTASTAVTSGQDSPRIILKINKNHNNETMQSEIIQSNVSTFKNQNDLKRTFAVASNITSSSPTILSITNSTNSAHPELESKKQKLDCNIVKNSDKVLVDNEILSSNLNNEIKSENFREKDKGKEPTKLEESKTNLKGILTRLTRRYKEENLKTINPTDNASESNHKKSIVNEIISLDNEESSSDCMIVDDPLSNDTYAHIKNVENNENHMHLVVGDESNSAGILTTNSINTEIFQDGIDDSNKNFDTPIKRGRGRPRKVIPTEIEEVMVVPEEEIKILIEPVEPEPPLEQEDVIIVSPTK